MFAAGISPSPAVVDCCVVGKQDKSSPDQTLLQSRIDWFRDDEARSAATAAKLVELPSVPLGRPTCAALSFEDRRWRQRIALGQWRTVIDEARDRDRRTYPLRNDLDHIGNSFSLVQAGFDPIAHLDRRRRLRCLAVDLYMPGAARPGSVGTRLCEPNRPQPLIDPSAFHTSILHQKLVICRARLA